RGNDARVASLVFSRGSDSILVGRRDFTVNICSVTSGKLLGTLEATKAPLVGSLAISPVGGRLCSGSKFLSAPHVPEDAKRIEVDVVQWDVADRKRISERSIKGAVIHGLSYSPDTSFLAISQSGEVELCD